MAPRSSLLVLVALVFTTIRVGASAIPSCPHSLEGALASADCHHHVQRLLSTEASKPSDVSTCLDAVRSLMATSSMPCRTLVDTRATRRLVVVSGHEKFEGKLNCTFDKSKPNNASDLSQGFALKCDRIDKPYNYTWVCVVLGIIGGLVGLAALFFLAVCLSVEYEEWRDRRRARGETAAEAPPVNDTHTAV